LYGRTSALFTDTSETFNDNGTGHRVCGSRPGRLRPDRNYHPNLTVTIAARLISSAIIRWREHASITFHANTETSFEILKIRRVMFFIKNRFRSRKVNTFSVCLSLSLFRSFEYRGDAHYSAALSSRGCNSSRRPERRLGNP